MGKQVWQSDDGKYFNTEKEMNDWEDSICLREEIRQLINNFGFYSEIRKTVFDFIVNNKQQLSELLNDNKKDNKILEYLSDKDSDDLIPVWKIREWVLGYRGE